MEKRLSQLKELIAKNNLDAILISSVPNIVYLTNYSNFSKDEREAYLLITSKKQYIITDGRYSEAVINNIKHFELIEISVTQSLKDNLKNLAKTEKIKKLGIEETNITVKEHRMLSSSFDQIIDFSIDSLRSIKEEEEIKKIEKACKIGDKTFDYILGKIKEGITEKELAFNIEQFIKKQGADISFSTIVAYGANSSIPHHQTRDYKLTTNNLILLDFGVKLDNYCSDMTRTVFFGKANAEQRKMYQTVLETQKRSIEFLNHKSSILNHEIKASSVDKIARDYILSQGYPTIPHSLGHGIGLEVHESPRLSPKSKDVLKKGMVFSIEPGIYLPGFGGVRIEDLAVMKNNNLKILTTSPKHLIEL